MIFLGSVADHTDNRLDGVLSPSALKGEHPGTMEQNTIEYAQGSCEEADMDVRDVTSLHQSNHTFTLKKYSYRGPKVKASGAQIPTTINHVKPCHLYFDESEIKLAELVGMRADAQIETIHFFAHSSGLLDEMEHSFGQLDCDMLSAWAQAHNGSEGGERCGMDLVDDPAYTSCQGAPAKMVHSAVPCSPSFAASAA